MLGGPRNVLLRKITHAGGKEKPKEWFQAPVGIVCKTIYNYTKFKLYINIENLVKYPENCFFLPLLPYSAASRVYCWTTYG